MNAMNIHQKTELRMRRQDYEEEDELKNIMF